VVVAVCHNVYKDGHFTPQERLRLIGEALKDVEGYDRVESRVFSGLLVRFFDECGADIVVRGMRNTAEYERDLTQAQANRIMNPKFETLYLPADPAHVFLSSSIVKEIAAFGGDIRGMVPRCVEDALAAAQTVTLGGSNGIVD